MQNNIEFCVYGGFNNEVRGVEEIPANSLWDESLYYSAPLEPASSGSYFSYLNGDINVYNSGYYQELSYPVYYPLINEYSPDNFYYSYYKFVPVYCHYFVPNYNYYLPRSEYVVTSSNSFEQGHFYESPSMSPTVEPELFTYEEYDSSIYNIQNGSFNDGSVEEIVGEAMTTCHFSYAEYPEILDEAANGDTEESLSSDATLEEYIVTNAADINEITVVSETEEQPYGVYMNACDEDVDENIIKKVSLMSIAEVQQDIDETYEYGKANLYNEVLKGYTEIKCTLEELGWECHTLDDIQEEEEPETDSDEMDFNENVLKNTHLQEDLNKDKFPDIEGLSHFASDSLSEKSPLASSQEALVDNCEIMVKDNELSMDSSIAEEIDKTDPILELALSEEKLYPLSMNCREEDYPPVDSQVLENNHKMISGPHLCLSKEEIDSGTVSGTEEIYPSVDSPDMKKNIQMNSVPDMCSNKEEIDFRSVSVEEQYLPMDLPIEEENDKMNSVQDLCLNKEEIDSACLGNVEGVHANVSSEDKGEEIPDILEPAAKKTTQRKKRFSSLRKFFGRICCCVKKPS